MSHVLTNYKPAETISLTQHIRFHPDLTFGEKMFLAEMQSMSVQGNVPSFSSRSLSELFGVSHQTVLNWIRKLTSMNLLKLEYNASCSDKKKMIIRLGS